MKLIWIPSVNEIFSIIPNHQDLFSIFQTFKYFDILWYEMRFLTMELVNCHKWIYEDIRITYRTPKLHIAFEHEKSKPRKIHTPMLDILLPYCIFWTKIDEYVKWTVTWIFRLNRQENIDNLNSTEKTKEFRSWCCIVILSVNKYHIRKNIPSI